MLDKQAIIDQIMAQLQADRETLERAAKATRDGATHEESAAEHRYDTRGLEASYLAGAQAKRAKEIETAHLAYQTLTPRNFTTHDPLAVTALIQLEGERGTRWYFLGPLAGGMKIDLEVDGETVQATILTPQSPLGQVIFGASEGDVVELERAGDAIEFEIISAY